jgi:hypothetical protein
MNISVTAAALDAKNLRIKITVKGTSKDSISKRHPEINKEMNWI